MALKELLSALPVEPRTALIGVLIVGYFAWTIQSYYRLSHIPGPWYAAFSNIPRLYWVWTRKSHLTHLALHAKYGPLVRLGPNAISVAEPDEIPTIYTFTGTYSKSKFYGCLSPYNKGKEIPMMFTTQSEEVHRMLKKPVASIYSVSNLLGFEQFVDSTIHYFYDRLETKFVNPGVICDISAWFQRFAFDVMGEITVSKRLGFLAEDASVETLAEDVWQHFQYAAMVGQMPWLDKLFKKNPVIGQFRTTQPNPIIAYTFQQMAERKKFLDEKGPEGFSSPAGEENPDLDRRDFMSRFFEARIKDPSLPDWSTAAWSISNIAAGSDTTAITLRTIFYHLHKYPQTLSALLDELKTAKREDRLSDPVTWKEAQQMPYLDACIKEAGRVHPAFGLPLERIVPNGGAQICDKSLPEGTIVGVHQWAAHRSRSVFGEDVDAWRPDRWLVPEEKRRSMEKGLLTFGAGNRTCIGKNIALLEIYKLVPSLLQRYNFELVSDEWEIQSCWFVHQRNVNFRITPRGELLE